MSRSYADLPRLVHAPDCNMKTESDGYDITGIRYRRCFGCDAFAHEPLALQDQYLGYLSRWPDIDHTPWGHESGLIDFPSRIYSLNFTFHRSGRERFPVLKNPVPLAFDPRESIGKDDSKDHEGVSFREVWTDPIARTIWLGHKPFMITNQYFRSYCLGHADILRKNPERLLGERVAFHFDGGFAMNFNALGPQLVPFLISGLISEGLWPFFKLPESTLTWKYNPAKAS